MQTTSWTSDSLSICSRHSSLCADVSSEDESTHLNVSEFIADIKALHTLTESLKGRITRYHMRESHTVVSVATARLRALRVPLAILEGRPDLCSVHSLHLLKTVLSVPWYALYLLKFRSPPRPLTQAAGQT